MRIRHLVVCGVIVLLTGCLQRIYYRDFIDEEIQPVTTRGEMGDLLEYYQFTSTCCVSSNSPYPIIDSAFRIVVFVIPIDRSRSADGRILQSLAAHRLLLLDTGTGDTLAQLAQCGTKLEAWGADQRRLLDFGQHVLSSAIQRITLELHLGYEGSDGLPVFGTVRFRMWRRDGSKQVPAGWWQH